MPYAEVDAASVDPHAAALLPSADAERLTALPVGFSPDDDVVVAVADPNDPQLLDALQQAIGLPVTLALAPRRALLAGDRGARRERCGGRVRNCGARDAGSGVRARRRARRRRDGRSPAPAVPGSTSDEARARLQPPSTPRTPTAPAPVGALLADTDGTFGLPLVASEEEAALDLDPLLKELVERGGSDLHLTTGIPPADPHQRRARAHGRPARLHAATSSRSCSTRS